MLKKYKSIFKEKTQLKEDSKIKLTSFTKQDWNAFSGAEPPYSGEPMIGELQLTIDDSKALETYKDSIISIADNVKENSDGSLTVSAYIILDGKGITVGIEGFDLEIIQDDDTDLNRNIEFVKRKMDSKESMEHLLDLGFRWWGM